MPRIILAILYCLLISSNLKASNTLPKQPNKKTSLSPNTIESTGKSLFENHCGVCHNLALPRSQNLDRNAWNWVVEDMVKKYKLNWLKKNQLEKIITYLTKSHGPKESNRSKQSNATEIIY